MDEAKGMVKHVLLLKFKEDTSPQQINWVLHDYAKIIDPIPRMKSFVWGTDVSAENRHQGFTHIVESTFESTKGVTEYLVHPAHVKFTDLYLPLLNKFLVFDYKPTSVFRT